MARLRVSGMVSELLEDIDLRVDQKGTAAPVKVKGKRCRWCGWTAVGYDNTATNRVPEHKCRGPKEPKPRKP